MDCRANIKIEFSIYGERFSTEMSINYWPDTEYQDERVKEWFGVCYKKARHKYELKLLELKDAVEEPEYDPDADTHSNCGGE